MLKLVATNIIISKAIFAPILFIKTIGNENTYRLVNYFSKGFEEIVSIIVICILIAILYIYSKISVKFYKKNNL
ncbi:hypothetical protein [Clostridium saccharobutylicum]|uniref:Uncharacterized protein n=1 Tax=Clostridium saccharobutylicum DSM 13864 TaxID=1345695 RepID=U5MLM3_CLOSA|nr:hypothetical protein [Clostridium saccharobutylicum]AGX41709.1 hypothetical protein CLSA_c06960 [Clostridium saccharobutylicum DSM 13864]AQR88990.1 hypothetical protein CLOSC_06860 [Clostridium saccharobutylicum]AQR98891.1 hypothetical protein CSACC_06930 [Clostridium saccharobutylicum]AQS08610.1 hypothetical protein CLOBY_07200 [Clostridium saccharobutylicum]AQS12879.1 hypothetical protein CLOSACC_06930 [Clostridium saccharobutylicum]